MNIIIVGAGFTGVQLTKRLVNEGNKVTLIDNNGNVVHHASNILDCAVVTDDGNNLETLEAAGIAKADALVCVTESDEINMITCSLVDSVYPDVLKIARVRNYAYYANSKGVTKNHAETFAKNHRPLYGIDFMVHPDVEAAEAIVRAINHGAVTDVISFDNSDYELIRIPIEPKSKMDGIEVKNARTLTDKQFILVYVDSEDGTVLPSGDTILHAGDNVGILTDHDNIPTMLDLCGSRRKELKNVALVGAGKIGTIVAEQLMNQTKASEKKRLFNFAKKKVASNFIIVDSDENLANQASAKFPQAQVFCADFADESFIEEEKIDKCDLVICATHNHELNLVLTAYVESLGVEKTIALVSSSAFGDIARKLGVDVTVPIRDTVIDSIMSHLRGKSVTGVHTVSDGEMEILECDLPAESKFCGKTLKEISSPGEYLVLLLRKHGQKSFEIPVGDTMLSAGDHLILIVDSENQKAIEKFIN